MSHDEGDIFNLGFIIFECPTHCRVICILSLTLAKTLAVSGTSRAGHTQKAI